jgi:hypothetical protein
MRCCVATKSFKNQGLRFYPRKQSERYDATSASWTNGIGESGTVTTRSLKQARRAYQKEYWIMAFITAIGACLNTNDWAFASLR